MKKKSLLIIIAIVIAIAYLYSSGKLELLGQTVDGCDFIMPFFGRIECEPVSHVQQETYDVMYKREGVGWAGWTAFGKCGDNENSPKCDFKFTVNSKFTGVAKYRFCTSATESACASWYDLTGIQDFYSGQEYNVINDAVSGVIVQVWLECGLFGADCPTGGRIATKYIPYGLNVYDSGMKVRYNTLSCDLGDLSWEDRYNVCTASDFGVTSEGRQVCDRIRESDRLVFDEWVNYLTSWVYVPMDMQNKIVTYSGQQAYCQINQVYSIGSFDTDGGCYKYPANLLGYVDCCPGMTTAGSLCGDDFQWHPIEIGECSSNTDCTSSYGSDYYCDMATHTCLRNVDCFSDLTCPYAGQSFCAKGTDGLYYVDTFGCVDGSCDKKTHERVDCCPPYEGCADGKICNPNNGYICEAQEGPDLVCGDDVCTAPYEDVTNCPDDCDIPPWLQEIFPMVVLGLLGGLVAYAKTRDYPWTAVGAIVGALAGWIGVMVMQWWESLGWLGQWVVGLGSLGGVGLFVWAFGGTILMIMFVLIDKKK